MNVGLTRKEITGLLCCAFEGGSNYWYQIEAVEWPDGRPKSTYAEGGSSQSPDPDGYHHWSALVPLDGGAIMIGAPGARGQGVPEAPHRLDGAALARGSALLAERFPQHWADARSQDEDADTGDVFLQLCLFGELVFG